MLQACSWPAGGTLCSLLKFEYLIFFPPFGVLAVVEEAAYAVKPHVLWYAVRNKLSKQTYLSSSQVPCIGRSCLLYYFLTRKIFMLALILLCRLILRLQFANRDFLNA